MCGIVGAVAERDVAPILLEGLRRLEYRGYDSAGMATINASGNIDRVRALGKVQSLADALQEAPVSGHIGIAHTRWATHGEPSELNAHPHLCAERVALVHNGIIENHDILRRHQRAAGHDFDSETDTEVVVHQIHDHIEAGLDLLAAVRATITQLDGAFALGVMSPSEPERLIAARRGSPLVIGVGFGEYFIASDVFALLPVTQRFIFLEEGDVADIRRDALTIYDTDGNRVERPIQESELNADMAERGPYRHFMLKEIFEQPFAVSETLEGRVSDTRILEQALGPDAAQMLANVEAVQIVACGTSYHAGLVARYWLEGVAGIACAVEIASEFRYRRVIVPEKCLFITISQSGETADTLAALRAAKASGYAHTLAICNVPESSLVRESEQVLLTRAGPEIGVASTKAFTTQLVALLWLAIALGRHRGLGAEREAELVQQLISVPGKIEHALELDQTIMELAEQFSERQHTLFLGRGPQYPVAMEGALKLKEISYIHAEAYAAGELKHGPLALVDAEMPVVAVAPNDALLEKLKANLHEVKARGGKLIVFADSHADMAEDEDVQVIRVAPTEEIIAPLIFTIPLQLLSYHVAVLRGTDVDQPRNLAKSVTVE